MSHGYKLGVKVDLFKLSARRRKGTKEVLPRTLAYSRKQIDTVLHYSMQQKEKKKRMSIM